MPNPELFKTRMPDPEPPTLAEIARLWRLQFSTNEIARMLGVPESMIHNMLPAAKRHA